MERIRYRVVKTDNPSRTRHLRGTSAFTLVEVLIALSVIAIALVALLHLQVISIRLFDRADRLTRATLLADLKMAEVLSAGYPELGTESGAFDEEDEPREFNWQTTVTDVELEQLEDAGVTGLRRVHVQVSWEESGQSRQVEMTTLVTRKR